jgi:hypothetical protein
MPAQRRFWVTAVGRGGRFVYQGHPDAAFQVDAAICKRHGMMPPFPYPQPPPAYVEPDYEAEETAAAAKAMVPSGLESYVKKRLVEMLDERAKALHAPPADKAVHAPPGNKSMKISPPPTRPRRKR